MPSARVRKGRCQHELIPLIRLALLLLGTQYVRSRWVGIAAIGVLLSILGLAVFIDGLLDVSVFTLRYFGYLFVIGGIAMVLARATGLIPANPLRFARSFVVIAIGALALTGTSFDEMFIGLFFGFAFLFSGVFRIASALMLRYFGWRSYVLSGVLEIFFSIFMFEPYPSHYLATLPDIIGAALVMSGLGLLRVGLELRTLPKSTLFALLSARDKLEIDPAYFEVLEEERREVLPELTVHVWTPLGTAHDPVHRPFIDRYVAAIDKNGVISTGHASLEVPPHLYISLYPANDIDHSASDFNALLRATEENNVGGRFLPSYEAEAADWCASTASVRFSHYNLAALKAFWNFYRLDTTYNLTNRNCSSTVAHALETALEGTLGDRQAPWFALLRVLCHWEFWVAGEIRMRAEAMAWTPGMVLDYARALEGILHPQRRAWLHEVHWKHRKRASLSSKVRVTADRE